MRQPAPAALTAAEAKAAIEALPPVGWLRLHRIARALCRHNRIDATDLLQEAFQRVLDGSRRCPCHIDIVRFLAGVMRSIASDWSKSRRRWRQLSLAAAGTLHETVLHVRDPRPDPLHAAAGEQEAACMLQAIRDLFADNPAALRMLEGMLDGMEGEALRSLTDLSETEFASKRRLIRRRIEKAFPRDNKP